MMLGYYVGAGASAKALPVAKDMPCRLQELANKIETYTDRNDNRNGRVEEIAGDFRWLADSSRERATVDALAYNCYLRDDKGQMDRLKKTSVLTTIRVPLPISTSPGRTMSGAMMPCHESSGSRRW